MRRCDWTSCRRRRGLRAAAARFVPPEPPLRAAEAAGFVPPEPRLRAAATSRRAAAFARIIAMASTPASASRSSRPASSSSRTSSSTEAAWSVARTLSSVPPTRRRPARAGRTRGRPRARARWPRAPPRRRPARQQRLVRRAERLPGGQQLVGAVLADGEVDRGRCDARALQRLHVVGVLAALLAPQPLRERVAGGGELVRREPVELVGLVEHDRAYARKPPEKRIRICKKPSKGTA